MTISMAVDEERSGKRKIKKFNFYEEEDNKLRNNINQERIIKGASNLSKSAKKDQEKQGRTNTNSEGHKSTF